MQIVIDIPEEVYKCVMDGTYCGTLYEELKTGTPLPKGHGRLIDADALYDQFEYADYDFEETLEYAPTILEADKAESEVQDADSD